MEHERTYKARKIWMVVALALLVIGVPMLAAPGPGAMLISTAILIAVIVGIWTLIERLRPA